MIFDASSDVPVTIYYVCETATDDIICVCTSLDWANQIRDIVPVPAYVLNANVTGGGIVAIDTEGGT